MVDNQPFNFNDTTQNNGSASERYEVELRIRERTQNNPDVATSHHNYTTESTESDRRLTLSQIVSRYEQINNDKVTAKDLENPNTWHLIFNDVFNCTNKVQIDSANRNPKLTCEYMGWDDEFSNEQTLLRALTYYNPEFLPKSFDDYPHYKKKDGVWLYHNNGSPIFANCYLVVVKQRLYCKRKEIEPLLVSFSFDHKGTPKGMSSYQHLCGAINNVERFCGLRPLEFKDNVKQAPYYERHRQEQTKIITTFSNAEFSSIIPYRHDRRLLTQFFDKVGYLTYDEKTVDKNGALGDTQGFELKGHLNEMQGVLFGHNIPITNGLEDKEYVSIDDTILKSLGSVESMGDDLPTIAKVKGFNFNENSPEHYHENDFWGFAYYNCIDSMISVWAYANFYSTLEDAIDKLAKEGLINAIQSKKGGSSVRTIDLCKRKRTASGIAEVIAESYLEKEGVLGALKSNSKKLSNLFNANQKDILGGLNRRTTGNPLVEVFENIESYDFGGHYGECLIALDNFPLYDPVGVGYFKTTPRELQRWFDNTNTDWFNLTCDFTFPENTPITQRCLLQKDNGNSTNPRVAKDFDLRPSMNEALCKLHPDLEVTVKYGWQWNWDFVKDGGLKDSKPPTINFGKLIKSLKKLRHECGKKSPLGLIFKLIINSIYGKLAQSKEAEDPELLEQFIIDDIDPEGIALKVEYNSKISHSELANAVTDIGRAMTYLMVASTDAVLAVTDSIATTEKINPDLNKYKPNFDGYLKRYCESGVLEHETEGKDYFEILSNTRGRVNVEKSERGKCLLKLLKKIESGERSDEIIKKAKVQARLLALDIKCESQAKGISVKKLTPKFAKNGLKYHGDLLEQWQQCLIDHIDLLARKTITHEQRTRYKPKEVRRDHDNRKQLNQDKVGTLTKNGFDIGNMDLATFEDYTGARRLINRLVKDGFNPQHYYENNHKDFMKRLKQSKPKTAHGKRPNITNYTQRVIAILYELKFVSGQSLGELVGVGRATIHQWAKKLKKTGTLQDWIKELTSLNELDVKKLSHVSERQLCRVLNGRSENNIPIKDVTVERITQLLSHIETEFSVKFEHRHHTNLSLAIKKEKEAHDQKMAKVEAEMDAVA